MPRRTGRAGREERRDKEGGGVKGKVTLAERKEESPAFLAKLTF